MKDISPAKRRNPILESESEEVEKRSKKNEKKNVKKRNGRDVVAEQAEEELEEKEDEKERKNRERSVGRERRGEKSAGEKSEAEKREERRYFRSLAEKLVNPRKKFEKKRKVDEHPPPPPPPVESPPLEENVYQRARRLLQVRGMLVGREKEEESLRLFLERCLAEKHGGSVYVTGASGVGKSLTVSKALGAVTAKKAVLNLASEKVGSLARRLREEFRPKAKDEGDDVSLRLVEEACRERAAVLVVEECDQRQHAKTIAELYRIAAKTKLVMIGLGNSRSFCADLRLEPSMELVFENYSSDHLRAIMAAKLGEIREEVFEENALFLWAKKFAEEIADIRLGTAALVRAVDSAERLALETGQKKKGELLSGWDLICFFSNFEIVNLAVMAKVLEGYGTTKDSLATVAQLAPQVDSVFFSVFVFVF